MYEHGTGVAKDATKAMECYQKAAAQGYAPAQRNLGRMYYWGQGAAQDATKALEWLEKAALQGDEEAAFGLGVMHEKGTGVTKDVALAVVWYEKAAVQGYAPAQCNLGALYYFGNGVPKSDAKAVKWLQKAAAQRNAQAQNLLGLMHFNGTGVPKDAAKAVEWYERAAVQGDPNAQLNLGWMHLMGYGVPKDVAKAVAWYEKAAMQGDVEAQAKLGGIYFLGLGGVPKNAGKEFEWYRKAAAQGDADSQLWIASMYAGGRGVPKDDVLAYAWSILSVAGSNGGTTIFRDAVETKLAVTEKAEAQRLSSNWKKGQILVREGTVVDAASSTAAGGLSKKGTGTVFLVSRTGHAITNQHVAGDCTELRIQGRSELAKLVTEDKVNDLALVHLQGAVTDTATIVSEPGKLRQGEDVVAFGFPLNSVLSSGGNLTPGVVSALTGLGNNTNQIQITAPIQPGSSGSPVLNKKGEVVGVVSMKLDDAKMAKATGQIGQNVNFAVSGQTLKTFLDLHKVSYTSGSGFFSREKSTADLADEARKWTLVVECWK